jgi:hypothetical protein
MMAAAATQAAPPPQLPTNTSSHVTLCWRETDSNHRSRRQRDGRGDGPRPTTVISRDDLCLMAPSSVSVRHLRSATAERPSRQSGTDGSNPVPSSAESGANLHDGVQGRQQDQEHAAIAVLQASSLL